MKNKFFKGLITCLLVVPLCIGLFTACSCSKKQNLSNFNSKEIYMFSAITSASYLSDVTNNALQSNKFLGAGEVANSRPELVANDIESINTYLKMFEGYLLNGKINQTSSKPTSADGEYSKYNTKLTASLLNLDGTYTNFTMYYDEINSVTKVEIDDNELEEEVSTTLSGVMLVNNNVFDVTGEKVVETEDNETEIEIKFTTKSRTNPQNYIVVEQEMEYGEIEFEYKLYENGLLVSNTEIEFENDEKENEKELSLQFKNVSNGTLSNIKYSIEKVVVNGETRFEVRCKNNNQTVRFYVLDNGTTYTYVYENGFTETLNK